MRDLMIAVLDGFGVKPFSATDLANWLSYVINNPRDFIDAPSFYGPDRRRKVIPNYKGPFSRSGDK